MIVAVGEDAKAIAGSAKDSGFNVENIHWFPDSKIAGGILASKIKSGDIVLVKGSQSTRMEKICEAIIGNKEESKRHLVRQEKEWTKK